MTFHPNKAAVLLVAFGAVGACTTELKVRSLPVDQNPVAGLAYQLPMASYDTTITRRIVACKPVDKDNPTAPLNLDISVVVNAEARMRPDPKHIYQIDYRTLSSGLKSSELSVDLHDNGMLKMLNAKSTDATSAVVSALASTASKVLLTAAGLAPALDGGVSPDACFSLLTDDAREAFDKRKDAKSELDTQTKHVEEHRKEVARLNKLAAIVSDKLRGKDQNGLLSALKKLDEAEAALAKARATYDKQDKILTHVSVFSWPQSGDQFNSDPMKLPAAQAKKWFRDGADANAVVKTAVRFMIKDEDGNTPKAVSPKSEGATNWETDLVYRSPKRGKLTYCVGKADSVCSEKELDTRKIPQLGRLFALPYKNRPFEDNTLSATFAADGALLSVRYVEASSRVAAAAGALDALATTAATTIDRIGGAELAEIEREAAVLEAEFKVLSARDKLLSAREKLSPQSREAAAEEARILSDKTIAEAELAALKARRERQQIIVGPNRATVLGETLSIERVEADIIQAQIDRIERALRLQELNGG